jgi:hypothetical protein
MFPKTLTVTVTSANQEYAVEQALAMAQELDQAANQASDGKVLQQCESLAVERGREFCREVLAKVLQARAEATEKKGVSADGVRAAPSGRTKGLRSGRC